MPRYADQRNAMDDPILELSKQAEKLHPRDRARLAEALLASLEDPAEPANDALFREELAKRIADVEAGRVQLISAEEAFASLRRSLRTAQ
jgi:putative addiction module component (TIGR02574 family)